MNTSEVLNRAADLIEERGWVSAQTSDLKYDLWGEREPSGPICLEGGIVAAAGIGSSALLGCPAYRAVWDHLQSDNRWGVCRDRLYDWNDTPGRTDAEVVEVLRAVALIEAARENAEVPALSR